MQPSKLGYMGTRVPGTHSRLGEAHTLWALDLGFIQDPEWPCCFQPEWTAASSQQQRTGSEATVQHSTLPAQFLLLLHHLLWVSP